MVAGLTRYPTWNLPRGLVIEGTNGEFEFTIKGKEVADEIICDLLAKRIIEKREMSEVEQDYYSSSKEFVEAQLEEKQREDLEALHKKAKPFLLNKWKRDYQQEKFDQEMKEIQIETVRRVSHICRVPLFLLAGAAQVVKILFKTIFLAIPTEISDRFTGRYFGNITGFSGIKKDIAITISIGIKILSFCVAPKKNQSLLKTCEAIYDAITWERNWKRDKQTFQKATISHKGEELISKKARISHKGEELTISKMVSITWNTSFPNQKNLIVEG